MLRNYVVMVRDYALEPLSSHASHQQISMWSSRLLYMFYLLSLYSPSFYCPTSSEPLVLPYPQGLAPTQSWSFHQFLILWIFHLSEFFNAAGPCFLLWNNKLTSAEMPPLPRDHICTLVYTVSLLKKRM